MGIFGPTKKGGGLDRRFSSNKGGYTGKIMGLFSAMSSSSEIDDIEDEKKKKEMDDRLKYFDQKGDNLTSRDIPEDEKGVIDFIDEMIGIIELNGWHAKTASDDSEEAGKQAQGRISDSAMSKLEIGIFKLYALGSPYHMFYEKKYESLKKKRFRGKYGLYIVIAIVFIILIFANILMGNF